MPHECTNCGRTFPDGSKEMLSGCPDCGGNKFQFAPAGRATAGSASSADTATAKSTDSAGTVGTDPSGGDGTTDSTGTVERAAETVRGWVSSGANGSDDSARAADAEPTAEPSHTDDLDAPNDPSRSGRTDRSDRSERSWPGSDDPTETDSSTEPGEFDEWPETARRPEDRSTPSGDDSSETSGDRPPSASGSQSAHDAPPAPDSSPASDSPADRSAPSADRSVMAESENSAQADARSGVVSKDDLPQNSNRRGPEAPATGGANPASNASADAGDQPPDHGRVVSEPSGDQPSIEELRAELNEQFESIKIVSPGQYELNLMELYNREEYIISLQEDGRYVIDVPDSWRADED